MSRRLAVMAVFVLHALVVGSLFSRIAEIQKALGLSEAGFGLTLMGLPAGVLVGSPVVGRLIERWGVRPMLLCVVPGFAAALTLVALAGSGPALFAALALVGLLLTTCNIAMNVEADRVEAATGQRLLNRCHGSWGLGFLAVSSLGAAAIAAGISPFAHFTALTVVVLIAVLAIVRPMDPSPPRAAAGAARPGRLALPTAATLLVAGFALSGVWLEGSTRNWAIIYMRDVFGAAEWMAALALPAIVSTQTLGRFLADGWIERHGIVRVSRVLAVVSLAGLVLVAFSGATWLALAGFALIGLGVSTTLPMAISAVARFGDRPAAENVAAFSSVQTVIVFLSPPIFGFVAGAMGLRASFALVLPLPFIALWFARYLAPGAAVTGRTAP